MIIDTAMDQGVTFFDVADEYGPDGLGEEYLGRALGKRRNEVIIATKFGHHMFDDPERGGAGARWIGQAVEDSLHRLGTDHIDLYQQHFPDPTVAAEETMSALDRMVRQGKVLEIGVCNLAPSELDERTAISDRTGGARLASTQNRLNLLRQEALDALVPPAQRNDLAVIPYFPLASGMLTGQYRHGQSMPEDSRFVRSLDPAQAHRIVERASVRVAALDEWAAQRGHSVGELAIAWLASMPFLASVIAGATKPAQIVSNTAAARRRLTEAEMTEVSGLSRVA